MSPSHPFICFERRWEVSTELAFSLGECKSILKAICGIPIKPQYRKQLYTVSLAKGALATAAIEGNTLSEKEVREIQSGKSLSGDKEYMGKEVQNLLRVLNDLRDQLVKEKRNGLVNPELICDFHRRIGEGLGRNFEAIPGSFRNNNVIVGSYRPPIYSQVPELLNSFCQWSQKEFHYKDGQSFSTAIIQAIVSHVYLAWIHPFGDGNGRTARLLEFYLLLRAGAPDIAAHVLSNHYNETREEYYKQLKESSSKNNGDLSAFINYAIRGFKKGLSEILELIQKNQMQISWETYVYEVFDSHPMGPKAKASKDRQISLAVSMETGSSYEERTLTRLTPALRVLYDSVSNRTIDRDLKNLLEMELIRLEDGKYRANTEILRASMAQLRQKF